MSRTVRDPQGHLSCSLYHTQHSVTRYIVAVSMFDYETDIRKLLHYINFAHSITIGSGFQM